MRDEIRLEWVAGRDTRYIPADRPHLQTELVDYILFLLRDAEIFILGTPYGVRSVFFWSYDGSGRLVSRGWGKSCLKES